MKVSRRELILIARLAMVILAGSIGYVLGTSNKDVSENNPDQTPVVAAEQFPGPVPVFGGIPDNLEDLKLEFEYEVPCEVSAQADPDEDFAYVLHRDHQAPHAKMIFLFQGAPKQFEVFRLYTDAMERYWYNIISEEDWFLPANFVIDTSCALR